jgi:hypothetical protein
LRIKFWAADCHHDEEQTSIEKAYRNPVTNYSAKMYLITRPMAWEGSATQHIIFNTVLFGFLIYAYNYGVIIVVGTWNRSLFSLEESILLPQKCHQSELPATSALLLAAFFLLAKKSYTEN